MRYGYLDAFRGLSMILVVFGHVILHSMKLTGDESVLNMVMQTFRMPSFFFISGFVAYRALERWDASYLKSIMLRKFQAQIVGAAFFIAVLYFSFPKYHIYQPTDLNYGAYWFTITLFRIFMIYTIIVMICRWLNRCIHKRGRQSETEVLMCVIMIILSIVGCVINVLNVENTIAIDVVGRRTLNYFQFFTLGVIVRKIGMERVGKYITGNGLGFIFMIFLLISMINIQYVEELKSISLHTITKIVVCYFGIGTMFGLFYTLRDEFEKFEGISGRIAKMLRYTGRRTLDIYFLHYFFLPNLRWMHKYFSKGVNEMVPQIITASVVTLVIVGLCLLFSYMLRCSPILRSWLFGVKREVTVAEK